MIKLLEQLIEAVGRLQDGIITLIVGTILIIILLSYIGMRRK